VATQRALATVRRASRKVGQAGTREAAAVGGRGGSTSTGRTGNCWPWRRHVGGGDTRVVGAGEVEERLGYVSWAASWVIVRLL
jgi:hypothetical protein